MCGIAGILHFDGRRPDEAVLRTMCDLIRHRGPDDEGIHTEPGAGIGMRRLAIIDLTTGRQPMSNEDGSVWVVLNGEIYNFQEIRERLAPRHRFTTKSDTEVIVHLYEEYGDRCVEHLRGMFAFAVWDRGRRRMLLARDRVGKKPLYYAVQDGSLYFASEIRSVTAALAHAPTIDRTAIDLFLTYQYIPSPRTIYAQVSALSPGHILSISSGGDVACSRYWEIDFTRKTDLSFPDAVERVRELMAESVRLRMISDVPLGAFLSGGYDSSIIVGLMSRFSERPVKTFAIGFEESGFSELPYARAAAEHFGTEHREFVVKADFIDLLPRIVWHYGQPFADSSALPSFIVSRETRRHVTVALNGDGGDESFGGYLRYRAMKASRCLAAPFRLLGPSATRALAGLIPHTETARPRSIFRYARRLVDALGDAPELRNIVWHSFFTHEARAGIYSEEMKGSLAGDSYDYMAGIFRSSLASTLMDRTFATDINAYLPECLLVKMDIASMANSLEARSPFLDHVVMEFCASLPDTWKVRGLTLKYILKKAFDRDLPPKVVGRGKMGFGIPLGQWFRGQWSGLYRDTVLSDTAIKRGYFNRAALERLLDDHVSGRRDNGYRLWALLTLELWHRVVVDKSLPVAP